MDIKPVFKKLDMRAVIIFIAAHFASVGVYNSLVVDGAFAISDGGFILHMAQATIYSSISFFKLSFKLKVIACVTAVFYCLLAINWVLLDRGIEVNIQSYFYDTFSSIIMTINLIVIYLLGKDSVIHLFNMFLKRPSFFSRIRLLFRGVGSDAIRDINLPIRPQNFKSQETSK